MIPISITIIGCVQHDGRSLQCNPPGKMSTEPDVESTLLNGRITQRSVKQIVLIINVMIDEKENTRPLSSLSVGELMEILDGHFKASGDPCIQANPQLPPRRLVYGLRGIQTLFNCSHRTAFLYKRDIIREAVSQNGRKIVVDADLALKLFNERRGNNGK